MEILQVHVQIFGRKNIIISITVVLRESLSIGVPGQLWRAFSEEKSPSTDEILGLLIVNLALQDEFWVELPFIKALKSTLPMIISMTGCANQIYKNVNQNKFQQNSSSLDKMLKFLHFCRKEYSQFRTGFSSFLV